MADISESLAQMVSSVVHKLYYFGNLCVTIGVFLLVVAVLRERYEFVIIAVRLMIGGFGVAFWGGSTWKSARRLWSLLFFAVSIIPSRFYATALGYLK